MLARLQRAFTLLLVLAALGWVVAWTSAGRLAVAVVGAGLILFGYAIVLATESVMAARANRSDPAPKASLVQWVRAWWGETRTAPRVFNWRQPFFWDAVPDSPDGPGRRGIVFVHGFLCNRGFWTPWLERCRAEGIPFVAVSLEPVFGRIDEYVESVEAAVRRLEAGTGLAPVVVAHSMGGLAARAWLQARQADARVHHVVTIGSPHGGTLLARHARTPNGRQMRRDSRWLQALAAAEPRERYRRFTCFYGHCDNIVFPASTAALPGAYAVHLAGIAHVAMAFHPGVWDEVRKRLHSPPVAGPDEGPGRGQDGAGDQSDGGNSGSPGSTAPAAISGWARTRS
ncbi:MAG TPA: alpha/beta fold hydrolase [Burkholderiaceae bacterium]|nr:alpha/beta fold hydrolase [Burkholderiaceae bacterium]